MAQIDSKKHKDLLIMILALGDAYLEKGLYAEAAKRYNQLLEFNVSNKRLYTNFSKALMGLKRFDKYALDIYQKAIHHDPQNTEIYPILAGTYLKEGREDEQAVKIYELAFKHESPIFKHLAKFLGTYYARKSDFEKCLEITDAALEKTEDYEEILPQFMESIWKTGNYSKATARLKKLIDLKDNDIMLLRFLCITYLEKKFAGELNNVSVKFSHIDRQLILDYLNHVREFETLQELSFYLELKRFLGEKEYWGALIFMEEAAQEQSYVLETASGESETVHQKKSTPQKLGFDLNREVLTRLHSYDMPVHKGIPSHSNLTYEDFEKEGAAIFQKSESGPAGTGLRQNAEICVVIEFSNFRSLENQYGPDHTRQLKNKLFVMMTDLMEKYKLGQIWGAANGLVILTNDVLDSVSFAAELLNKLNRYNFVGGENEEIHLTIGIHHGRMAIGHDAEQTLKDLSTGIKIGILSESDLSEEDRPIYGKVVQKKNRIFLSSKAYREIKSSNRFKINSIGQFKLKYLKDTLSLHEVAWRDPIDDLKFGYIKKLGRFDLLAEISEKGPIKVFKGKDANLQRFVIMKVIQSETFNALPANNAQKQQFYQMARAQGQMSHPNIVNIYEVDEDQGLTYIAREFIEGMDITAIFREGKSFNSEQVIQIIYQICKGLQYSHRFGFFHLNLKPSNIRVGSNHEIKIMDFHIPGELLNDRTHLNEQELAYESPEQIQGARGDARSDVFSLGVILYELVTGRHPFINKDPRGVSQAILTKNPLVPSEINPGVIKFCDALILKCLRKDPDKRIQSIEQIVTLLKKNFESTLFSSFNYHIAQSRDSY